jgi:hypothetical protein
VKEAEVKARCRLLLHNALSVQNAGAAVAAAAKKKCRSK